jgi:hypothetical protein
MGFQRIVDLAKQIRQVGRGLLRSPGFTFTGVATMALSIGATTTIQRDRGGSPASATVSGPNSPRDALVRSAQQGYSEELDFLSGHTGLDT